METRLDHIPNYIQASSPQGLRRSMFQNNLRLGLWIKYFDIQFVNGKWIAWYYESVDFGAEIQKTTKGK